MRAAIYARTACSNQESNVALGLQVKALRAHAAQSGMSVVAEFTDEGYSGLRRDRPGLDGMRALAESRGFDVLLTCNPERLARDAGMLARMLEELGGFGVRTIFLEGGARAEFVPQDALQRLISGRAPRARGTFRSRSAPVSSGRELSPSRHTFLLGGK
jgi:DNA invertase Pin-like site-specific DNA recombinase